MYVWDELVGLGLKWCEKRWKRAGRNGDVKNCNSDRAFNKMTVTMTPFFKTFCPPSGSLTHQKWTKSHLQTNLTSSDNPWKLIFSTTILINSVSLLFCTFIGFLQLRHRTRFRDSFCLASVFKCLFTYLLTTSSRNSLLWSENRNFSDCGKLWEGKTGRCRDVSG